MDQLWTITFVAVFAAAFGIAHWHDREEAKRRERMDAWYAGVGDGAASQHASAPPSRRPVFTVQVSDETRAGVCVQPPPSYNEGMKTFEWGRAGYTAAVLGVVAATAALKLFGGHVNSTTVALVLLLFVLSVATAWGSRPAVLASVLGVLSFNFFYLPPVGRWTIDD